MGVLNVQRCKNTVLLHICTNCAHFIHSPMIYKHGQCRKFDKIYLTTCVIEYILRMIAETIVKNVECLDLNIENTR